MTLWILPVLTIITLKTVLSFELSSNQQNTLIAGKLDALYTFLIALNKPFIVSERTWLP